MTRSKLAIRLSLIAVGAASALSLAGCSPAANEENPITPQKMEEMRKERAATPPPTGGTTGDRGPGGVSGRGNGGTL